MQVAGEVKQSEPAMSGCFGVVLWLEHRGLKRCLRSKLIQGG